MIIICIIAYAIYHIANNAHARDKYFGRSRFARVIVFIGVINFLFMLPVVSIDVELENRQESSWFPFFYSCIIAWQLTFIWIVCPLIFAFYNTDDTDTYRRRLWDAFRL